MNSNTPSPLTPLDADQLLDLETSTDRHHTKTQRNFILALSIAWCLFQFSIASWLILDSTFTRSIHLAFALALVFLYCPAFTIKKKKEDAESDTVPIYDILFAVVAACCALYITFDYEGIAKRQGIPTTFDLVVGTITILVLLEAGRRVIGPSLPCISILFIVYAFFAPYFPDALAFKGVSLNRFIGQMTMSTEGIYGIPLGVSAQIVFLFVLFGSLLEKAGGGRFFIQLALCFLGKYRGGPAKAAVLGSAITGSVCGSSIANVVTTGTFTIPLMKKVGYTPEKAAAIEVAASTDGQIAPPIMGAAAFIIAEYVNVPYLDVVKAALVPAFASYAALFYITHLEACKLGLQGLKDEDIPRFKEVFFAGYHFLIPVFVLFYQLVYKQFSAGKSAFSSLIVLLFIMLFQHTFKGPRSTGFNKKLLHGARDIVTGLVSGARNMLTVAIATALAGIIVGVIAMGPGGLIAEAIDVISMGNIYLMLIITAVACLLIGMGLPTTATYIVMATLTAPVIVTLAGNYEIAVPLMAAHLFCFYFGILADDTPPVGLAAYAAAAIAKSKPVPTGLQAFMYDIRTAILPFMFIFNPELILHGIDSWSIGFMILSAATIGNLAFASATQGWLIAKNRWFDGVILLMVTFIMMRPDFVAIKTGIGYDNRYWCYLLGISIFSSVGILQKIREGKTLQQQ